MGMRPTDLTTIQSITMIDRQSERLVSVASVRVPAESPRGRQ